MSIVRTLTLVLASWFGLCAQPSLQQLWARHDAFVMAGEAKPGQTDPARSFTFKGRRGQVVRGWDVGDPKAPVVLWWQGGPGGAAAPQYDAFLFPKPEAYRHLEIDQPGTGGSAWVPGWKPEDTIEDALTFLRLRGCQAPVLVTGWSWGSTMALLFAQRHPERVRAVVVGGVWTNTPAEVSSYLDAGGTRSWMPGLAETFSAFSKGKGSACALHEAIRQGQGGAALVAAYGAAEEQQCSQGSIPRNPFPAALPVLASKPVDMTTETDDDVRFAYIESEMMCRGQRGAWQLKKRFPKRLSAVPLLVIQGRYDQVCRPQVARAIYLAWPGQHKRLVPFNGGHTSFSGPSREARAQAGLSLSPEQEQKLRTANQLYFGSATRLHGAAIACLVYPDQEPWPVQEFSANTP